MKVIGYLRVSTDEQADKHGLDAQKHEIERWCKTHDHELIAVLYDVMSSGRTDKMYHRQIAMAALAAGIGDALLVRALDRATRSVVDGGAFLDTAKRQGWRLLDTNGVDSSDPNQEFNINITVSMAQEERRRISQRVKEGMAAAKRKDPSKTYGRPRAVPADVAKRIVRWRKAGLSAQAIARKLDAAGVPTPGGGQHWHHSVIRDVIRRETEEAR